MEFNSHNNSIRLIRLSPEPGKKRGKREVVGIVPRRTLALTDEIAAKLTADEARAFADYATAIKSVPAMQAKIYAFQIEDIVQQVIAEAGQAEGTERDMIVVNLSRALLEIRNFLKRQHANEPDAA